MVKKKNHSGNVWNFFFDSKSIELTNAIVWIIFDEMILINWIVLIFTPFNLEKKLEIQKF